MPARTVFLSRLIGLYCILCALAMMSHKQASVTAVAAVLHDPAMMFELGVVTTAAGLATVLAHNVWSGGALTLIVTVIGWLTLFKGLAFLFLPPGTEASVYLQAFHYDQLFYLYMTITLVIGAYLTYAGFTSKSR